MYVRPVSDIHNEFSTFNLPVTEFDSRSVLILAGDIAVADRVNGTLIPFLDSVTDRFRDILYIPGNHEYYHGSIGQGEQKLTDACKRYLNVHYANPGAMVIDDVFFIGATLWTDLNRGDPVVRLVAEGQMNDYRAIRHGPKSEPWKHKLKPIDTMALNNEHRRFIAEKLAVGQEAGYTKVVVFTHHGMSMLSRPPQYNGPLDYAYYNTGLEDMLLEYEPTLCIHGHSHHRVDYMIGKTRMVSNPRGYSRDPDGSEFTEFDRELVIEV